MFKIIDKHDELKDVLKKSHNFYLASDVETKKQFFADKSVDTLIFTDGGTGFLKNALFAFGNVTVKVFSDDVKEMPIGSFSGGKLSFTYRLCRLPKEKGLILTTLSRL